MRSTTFDNNPKVTENPDNKAQVKADTILSNQSIIENVSQITKILRKITDIQNPNIQMKKDEILSNESDWLTSSSNAMEALQSNSCPPEQQEPQQEPQQQEPQEPQQGQQTQDGLTPEQHKKIKNSPFDRKRTQTRQIIENGTPQ